MEGVIACVCRVIADAKASVTPQGNKAWYAHNVTGDITLLCIMGPYASGAHGEVVRVEERRSESLGLKFTWCLSYAEVLGKLVIAHCLCPIRSDVYLAE